MSDNPANSSELTALPDPEIRGKQGMHYLVAWATCALVAWHVSGALYAWTNTILATPVEGVWWGIRDAYMVSILSVFPCGIYAISCANTFKGKDVFKRIATVAVGRRAKLAMGALTAAFMAAWISGAIGVIAGGNVEQRDGVFVTVEHGHVTGPSTEAAYVFTKWLFSAAGSCTAAVFCSFAAITALAMVRRNIDERANPADRSLP
jgi:hypothetical protein